jgi:hypothetical protein
MEKEARASKRNLGKKIAGASGDWVFRKDSG